MFVNKLFGYCQKVLPLAYDESLSYYEFLCKMRVKLNEVIDVVNLVDKEVGDKVAEILNVWVNDGTFDSIINETLFERYNQFYVPEDFGGVGDGVTDCTEAFDKACKAMNTGDIKILFLPANKTYLIKTTIGIPANCMLIGAGKSSVIYYDETVTDFGVGITNAGDNVVIGNFTINHANNTHPIPYAGAMTGAISVGCLGHIGAVEAGVEYTRVDRKNCVVFNIWTDYGRYCLQTENYVQYDNNNNIVRVCSLENVYAFNIFAPNSMVSIAPRQGKMKNVHYENIRCHMLRSGAYSGSGYSGDSISINNFHTAYIQARGKNVVFNNGFIDTTGNIYYERAYCINLQSGNVFNNVRAIGGGGIGTCIYANGTDDCFRFNNCDFTGFTRFWLNGENSTPAPAYFNNCVVSQTGTSNADIKGSAVMGSFGVTPVSGNTFNLIGIVE